MLFRPRIFQEQSYFGISLHIMKMNLEQTIHFNASKFHEDKNVQNNK